MPRKALLITVGTGVGPDRRRSVESLSSGIAYSIKAHNPDKVVFLVTEDSERDTLPKILEKVNLQPEEYDVKRLRDMDDVESIYEDAVAFLNELMEEGYAKDEIVVDYTSGTKAMSAGVAIAGALLEVESLSYVTGKREGGVVVPGTERVLTIRPHKIRIDEKLRTVKEMFNAHQYDACVELLHNLKRMTAESEVQEKLSYYEDVCNAYSAWDKFEHERAYEILKRIKGEFGDNKEFLGKLLRSDEREPYLIADLLNNAERRMEEGKYDDAVARLYRTIELIAQFVLRSRYEINSSDVDTWHLRTLGGVKLEEKYEKLRDERGKVKLGLEKDYELLKDLNDELGRKFAEDSEIRNLLKTRNDSILAHGLCPVKKESAEKMFAKVKEYAREVVEDLDDKMRKAKFPKLE